MTFKEFLGVVVMPIAVAVVLVLTAVLFHCISETDRIEVKLVEAENEAWTSDYFMEIALTAALASAENHVADMEAGSLLDCIDATCRVSTVTSGRARSLGTGVVFKITDDKVHVITNAHVATTPTMRLEFWIDGHKQDAITGETILRDVDRDVAVIEVDAAKFKGLLPAVIPLAARDTVLEVGQEVWSAGCPRGEWTKAWVGHVLRIEGKRDRVVFLPPPFGGQSGSAIFNEGGTEIVALLNLQELDGRGKPIRGMAVNIREIHDAIYGEVKVKEVRWGRAPRGQCGPRGCPDKVVPEVMPGTLDPVIPAEDDLLEEVVPEEPDAAILYEDDELRIEIVPPASKEILEPEIAREVSEAELDFLQYLLKYWLVVIAILVVVVVYITRGKRGR
jgi:hypothetical protein